MTDRSINVCLIVEAVETLSCSNREDFATLSDNELQSIIDLSYTVALARTALANRIREREDQEIKDKEKNRRQAGQSINHMVNAMIDQVKALKEYKNLCAMAGLMAYARKKNDAGYYNLQRQVEGILDKYNLNEPRVIAHLVNMAG